MDKEKSLKKYLSITRGYFVFLFFLLFGLIFMMGAGPLGVVFSGITGLLFALIIQLPHSSRIKKKIAALKAAGQYEAALADFENATPIWNGKVRVGQKFIFAKGCSFCYAYDEILWLYRFNQSYMRLFTISSQLMIGGADGKLRAFCKLKKGKKAGGDQVQEIAKIVLAKNPTVILGFDAQRQQAYQAAVKK